MDWLPVVWMLAAGDDKAPAAPFGDFMGILPLMAILAVLFYLMLIRPQRREQATRDAMLAALKKNDKVQTIGGILGTVANISSDGKEVTLKVDDNTRIKFLRSSIQRVVASGEDADKPADSK